MELITTPAHPTSNSYISLTEAESYFTTYGRIASSDEWNNYTDDKKKFALAIATQMLDTFKFKGGSTTINQALSFPRFTWNQIKDEGRKQYKDFFWATREENLTEIIDSGQISISNNKLIDNSSSNDAFYSPHYNEELHFNQIIKQEGLSCDSYLTITDISADGFSVTIKESITDESAPSDGVTVNSTPLFGYPKEVGYAQAELAYQVVSTGMFQAQANDLPEPMPKSWDLGGNLSITYMNEMWGQSKFSPDKTSPINIVYFLLGNWIASVSGRAV